MHIDKVKQYHISEIFRSIQGEGNYSGVNALFVRFQLCNLRCTWCDTKYTWTAHSGEYNSYTLSELVDKIDEFHSKHIIFTGGEPTLYRLDMLAVDPSVKYHVETNGGIVPTNDLSMRLLDGTTIERDAMELNIIKNFNWVVSPKLKHSKQILDIDALQYWSDKDFAILKFVIKDSTDISEIDTICNQIKMDKNKVYIGLEGNTVASQMQPQLVEEIIVRGYHFSPRLHVLLWGDQRLR